MHEDIDELKLLILAKLDITDLMDLLDLEMADIVDLLDEHIEEHYARLQRACRWMKKEYHNPLEPIDKQHYKKRYLVRKILEQDAEQQIEEFNGETQERPTLPDHDEMP